MADHTLYEVKDSIATITMNRPDRMNSLSGQMMDLLMRYLREASSDPGVRCVVLTGSGDRAFSAGADLKARAERGGGVGEGPTLEQSIDGLQRQQEVLGTAPHHAPSPRWQRSTARLRALRSRWRSPATSGLQRRGAILRTAFSGIGFSGDFGSSYFLTNMVGSAKARELMLLGEKISAEDAHAMGLGEPRLCARLLSQRGQFVR